MRSYVLPSTVRTIRLKHRILHVPSQSHPRRIIGFLTVSQIAKKVGVPTHWIYNRIDKGAIQVVKEHKTKNYLFPDEVTTIESFKKLKNNEVKKIEFNKNLK